MDNIKPNHYKAKIDVIEFCMMNDVPFCEGNVIKYIYRWRNKNGVEDLLKAREYIDRLLKSEGVEV